MALTEARAAHIRADLHQRIAAIAANRASLNVRQLVETVDDIRSIAQSHGFGAVAGIAGRLESALAQDSAGATLLCYLDALDDAVTLEPVRQDMQQALLASVALRLGR
jgi:HPt (histidine-containing phosphotransfer) domain-containing protein